MRMANVRDPVKQVYDRWDRFWNGVSRTFGHDRELDDLSEKLDRVKRDAYQGGNFTGQARERVFAEMELIIEAYRELAERRGYPPGETLPATRESFRVYGEAQE